MRCSDLMRIEVLERRHCSRDVLQGIDEGCLDGCVCRDDEREF